MIVLGQYSIKFDKTGFPLIQKKGWNFFISLFPVSKYQFERFMVDKGPINNLYSDKWYRYYLSINPRCSFRNFEEKPWQLFITGLSIDELMPFIKYLGKGFRLPNLKEWRELLLSESEIQQTIKNNLNFEIFNKYEFVGSPVLLWLKNNLFPLANEGILEWIKEENTNSFSCIGKPFQEFFPNTWYPKDIKRVNWDIAKRLVGFRIVENYN